ncbi:MAG: hypothetical protein KDE51_20950 [Anaerolineales bacterium]|nr:hypothetical protein [Anaerolineales bacterium]
MDAVFDRLQSLRDDQLSIISVTVMTLLALTIGWGLKASVQDQTRLVSQNGITATVPLDWVTDEAPDTAALRVWNGRAPAEQFLATLYPTNEQVTIDSIVVQRNLMRGQQLNSYRVLDKVEGVINGRNIFEVQFAYVKLGRRTDLPQVIQGTDYYMDMGEGQVLVLTVEAESGELDNLLPDFENFKNSIQTGGTE